MASFKEQASESKNKMFSDMITLPFLDLKGYEKTERKILEKYMGKALAQPALSMLYSEYACEGKEVPVIEKEDSKTINEMIYAGSPFVIRKVVFDWPVVKTLSENGEDIIGELLENERISPVTSFSGGFFLPKSDAFSNSSCRQATTGKVVKKLMIDEKAHVRTTIRHTSKNPILRNMVSQFGSLSFIEEKVGGINRGILYNDRTFIYRGGCTDWHSHPFDEHFSVQLKGEKYFLLLPPDNDVYRSMCASLKKKGGWEGVDASPLDYHYTVRLRVGDGLYIPPNWWHAVVPADDSLGVTSAFVWPAKYRKILDLRSSANRDALYFPIRKSQVLFTIAAPFVTFVMALLDIMKQLFRVPNE